MVLRRVEIHATQFLRQEFARSLAQNARAIARTTIGSARATMHHRSCGRESEFYDFVRGRPAKVRKKTDATSVVLLERKWRLGIRDGNGAVVRDGANLAMAICS